MWMQVSFQRWWVIKKPWSQRLMKQKPLWSFNSRRFSVWVLLWGIVAWRKSRFSRMCKWVSTFLSHCWRKIGRMWGSFLHYLCLIFLLSSGNEFCAFALVLKIGEVLESEEYHGTCNPPLLSSFCRLLELFHERENLRTKKSHERASFFEHCGRGPFLFSLFGLLSFKV